MWNLDEHGVAMRRDDPRILRIKAVRNLKADARNPWGLCEAEGDLDQVTGAGAGSRQCLAHAGRGARGALGLDLHVLLEHHPPWVGGGGRRIGGRLSRLCFHGRRRRRHRRTVVCPSYFDPYDMGGSMLNGCVPSSAVGRIDASNLAVSSTS